jgi:alpha-L-rhamnosidase
MVEYAQNLAKEIRATIKKKYIKNGKMTIVEQTALAYALYYEISKENEATFRAQLLERIAQDGEVFTTGVLGARVLFRLLSDMGQGNLAYKLIVQNRYPSYGYNVMRGARTLAEQFHPLGKRGWEREDGRKHDSLNHHFWGDVSAWFILRVAGIQINPDFYHPDRVEIAPDFIDGLTFAQGKVGHRKGEIFSRWERVDGEVIKLIIVIPQGVEGILRLPIGYGCDNEILCAGRQEIIIAKKEK